MRIESKHNGALQKKLTEEITDYLISEGLFEYVTADGLTAKIIESRTEVIDRQALKEYAEIYAEVTKEKYGQRLLIN